MQIGNARFIEKRVIGEAENPLLIRYTIFRFKHIGLFVHKLCRSDHERANHDHPWAFLSLVLRGGYKEMTDTRLLTHRPGAILIRPATWRHRVIIGEKPAWTLVFVGKKCRHWGFWPNGKFCSWRKYNTDLGICEETELHHDDY